MNELIDHAIRVRPELAEITRGDLEQLLTDFLDRIIQDARLRKLED